MGEPSGTPDADERLLPELPPESRRRVWIWAFLIAVGGFLFGFDTGVISGALLFIKHDFHLDALEQGTIVSSLVLAAMVGALASGQVANRVGRRRIFGLEGVVFLVGTLIAVLATGYWSLLLSRVVLGLAVGAASATVPPYIAELTPRSIRGRALTLNQLMITVGILAAYLVNLAFSGAGNWRAMFAVGAVPAVLMVATSLWLVPEPLEQLLIRGETGRARRLAVSLVGEETADRFLERRLRAVEREQREQREKRPGGDAKRPRGSGWRALLDGRVRPALVVGLVLAAAQQFGGINTLIYYAPTIIEQSGLTASNAIFYSIAIGVINLLMTLVAVWLIDRLGRRDLLIFSYAAMAVTMLLLGLSFEAGWHPVVSLVFMVLYIASFAVGAGPVFWTLIGEIFPPRVRAMGSGASTATNWLSNFVVSLVFLSVVQAIGKSVTFWIFAVISAAALVFSVRFVPEAKGRDFPEVDRDLQARFGRRPPDTREG